jgi:hypothetical protein
MKALAAVAVIFTTLVVHVPSGIAANIKFSTNTACWRSKSPTIPCTAPGGAKGIVYDYVCASPPIAVCKTEADSDFNPTAFLGPHGRHVQIGGHVICAEGALGDLNVTITQHGTGAVAEGTTKIACTGEESDWQVQAATVSSTDLVAGPATACGLLVISHGAPDARQWCREVIEIE